MIVVDNSLLVPLILENEWSERARRIAAEDDEWIVPPLWQYEFTNVMVTFARLGKLSARSAHAAIEALALLSISSLPSLAPL